MRIPRAFGGSRRTCHLCNITLMLGRELKWDPDKEQSVGDDQATALMTRARRAPYSMEA